MAKADRNFLMQFHRFSQFSGSVTSSANAMSRRRRVFRWLIYPSTSSAMFSPAAICICSRRPVPSKGCSQRIPTIGSWTARKRTGCVLLPFCLKRSLTSLFRLRRKNEWMRLLWMTAFLNVRAVSKRNPVPACSTIRLWNIAWVIVRWHSDRPTEIRFYRWTAVFWLLQKRAILSARLVNMMAVPLR